MEQTLRNGNKVVLNISQDKDDCVTVSQSFYNSGGAFLYKTCTVTCSSGKSKTWTCPEDKECLGDCSDPQNPKGDCVDDTSK